VAVNCTGTLNLLEAARRQGVERFIHTSTSETYGTAQYTPIDEHHPLKGQSPYSARKIGADKLAESYHLSYETPVVTVRPFNTYGPRQSARAIIPTIIAILGGGKEIVSEDQRYRPQASKVMELLSMPARPGNSWDGNPRSASSRVWR